MAIERRNSGWRACWRNPFTKKIEKGPTRGSKSEAAADDADVKRRLEHDRQSFAPRAKAADSRGKQHRRLTFAEVAEMYISRGDLTDNTVRTTFSALKPAVQAMGSMPAESITRQDLRDYEAAQERTGLAQPTVHRKVKLVVGVLSWAREQGHIEGHKLDGHRVKKGVSSKELPPTPDEIRAILAHSPDYLRRAILLSYCLGLRFGPSEVMAARWEHFDRDARTLSVHSHKNKQRPWRRVPISNDSLLAALDGWRVQDGGVGFIVHLDGRPVRTVQEHWAKAIKSAGIQRRITPYDCRHAFATEALAGGADLKATALTMGHQDTTMILKHYQHVLNRQSRDVTAAVPDVFGEQNWGTNGQKTGNSGEQALTNVQ